MVPWLLVLFGARPLRRQHRRRHGWPTATSTRTLLVLLALAGRRPRRSSRDRVEPGRRPSSRFCSWAAGFGTVPGLQIRGPEVPRAPRPSPPAPTSPPLMSATPWAPGWAADHHRRTRLYLAHLGGRRHHTAGPRRHGVRGGRCEAARRRARRGRRRRTGSSSGRVRSSSGRSPQLQSGYPRRRQPWLPSSSFLAGGDPAEGPKIRRFFTAASSTLRDYILMSGQTIDISEQNHHDQL